MTTKETTPALTATKTNLTTDVRNDWGTENVDSTDILIPRILLMQGQSKLVTAEKAQTGQIIESVTNKVLAEKGKTLEFIPLKTFKNTIVMSANDNQFMYQREFETEDGKPPWEKEINGELVRIFPTLNFFVMLTTDLDSATAIPMVLSFRSTQYKKGRILLSYFNECKMTKSPPAANTFTLGVEKTSNDKGTWYLYDINRHEKTPKKYMGKLYEWWQILTGKGIEVDAIEKDVDASDDKVPF